MAVRRRYLSTNKRPECDHVTTKITLRCHQQKKLTRLHFSSLLLLSSVVSSPQHDAASPDFQNKSLRAHQLFHIEGQGFKQRTAGVVQLIGENGPLCDGHLTAQHHRRSSSVCASDRSNTSISLNRESISLSKLRSPRGFRLSDDSTMRAIQHSRRRVTTALRMISRCDSLRAMLPANRSVIVSINHSVHTPTPDPSASSRSQTHLLESGHRRLQIRFSGSSVFLTNCLEPKAWAAFIELEMINCYH